MEAKNRWQKGLFGSTLVHLLAFMLVAFITAETHSRAVPSKEVFVEVDYFSTSGGSGSEKQRPFAGVAEQEKVQEMQVVNKFDSKQIIDKKQKSTETEKSYIDSQKAVASTSAQHSNFGKGNGSGTGSVTGTGTGSGSGSGTGAGANTGQNQLVAVPPRLIAKNNPLYPEEARRTGAHGVVGLKIYINAEGNVVDVQVSSSSGNTLLDQAAVQNVRSSYRFQAARNRQGVAIKCVLNHSVTFNLH